ncbi:TorF family putative porin [Hyphomicrobium sp.]|uniref:TorF family putative porin n=1 Tax=Hyphomicrobium sp. TaxID=82 RepID=UPI002E3200B8|nr:TorF family putative porin [Hyphomicrobium sp.]
MRNFPKTSKRSTALLRVAIMAVALNWSAGAAAKDETIEPEPRPAPSATPSKFNFAYGLSFTTDYVSRGITQTGSDPAVQGYIEPSYGDFYANLWSSNVDFGGGFDGAEIDVAAGYRPEIGKLSLNVGWVHYFYAPKDTSPAYGEIFTKADYKLNDKITLAGRMFFAPDFSQTGHTATFIAGGAKVQLGHGFAAYGGIGYQFFEDDAAFEDLAWTAGLSYNWKVVTLDVRYWETDLADNECVVRSGFADGCDARVVGTISFDLTRDSLSELFGRH